MKTASVISTGLHILVLGWATLSFNGQQFDSTQVEAMPIDLVNVKEFSQMTKGVKDAPKVEEKPKPVVEKVAPTPPVEPADDLKPKITEKQEVAPNKEAAPPAEPETKPDDKIAEKIKDDKPKTEAKAEPTPMPPRKPPVPKKPPEPKFDPTQISALLDKREPTRHAETGEQMNSQASKGIKGGASSTLSASELSMFLDAMRQCWDAPAGLAFNAQAVPITISLNPDGSLSRPPTIDVAIPPGPMQIIAESAVRAILKCAPYKMFRQSNYEAWRILPLGFDPKFMIRG